MESETVIFQRGENDSEISEIWDDSALIEAYDKAVSITYEAVRNGNIPPESCYGRNSSKKKLINDKRREKTKTVPNDRDSVKLISNKNSSKDHVWNVGDKCYAQFSEDQLWYYATIVSLGNTAGSCVVRYDEYGNEEEQQLDALRSSVDATEETDDATSDGASSSERNASNWTHKKSFMMRFPPPLPPPLMADATNSQPDESEALASMLMSWYMSGYHTGYYQAMQDFNSKKP